MSPAGSTSEGVPLKLRPNVAKTFLKGVIAIGVFSIFLQINPSTFVHYLIFLALTVGALLVLVGMKWATRIEISEEGIKVKRLFKAVETVRYQDIADIAVSQGILARRFDCGTVYVVLKAGRGSVRMMGGGVAERLEDVPKPNYISDLLTSRLSPFGL